MRLVLALFLLLPAPLWARCEGMFRAGLAAYADADRALATVEGALYRGLGWASRGRVMARLEGRSATTSACQELGALAAMLDGAAGAIDRARARFTMARSLCTGENRQRAEGNLHALDDTAEAIATQARYVADLRARCRSP